MDEVLTSDNVSVGSHWAYDSVDVVAILRARIADVVNGAATNGKLIRITSITLDFKAQQQSVDIHIQTEYR